MTPSVRSRLWASGLSFGLGFGVANYGILMIVKPDQWLWIIAATTLMGAGAAGVLFADTRRAVSFWGVLGLQIFAIVTLIPLLWAFTVATTPPDTTAQTLWPGNVSWEAFDSVIHSSALRQAAGTSVLVSALATVIAMPLAVGAAYTFVRREVRWRRIAYLLVVATLLMPLVAVGGPWADQAIAWDVYGHRLALVIPSLAVTLPLAIWLSITVLRDVSWSLAEAVRADGATHRQMASHFYIPYVLPGLGVVALLVFVAGCQDLVLGAALSPDERTLPLPATLLFASGQIDGSSAVIAAAGLLWMLPALLLLLVFPRRINQLLGRSYR